MTRRCIVAIVLTLAVTGPGLSAQRSSGGGGAGGMGFDRSLLTRLDLLTEAFVLTKEQRPAVKALLDTAEKNAAPIREGLTRTRLAIATAIQSKKSQTEIDAAVKDYAVQATAMTSAEMKALAKVLQALTPEQRANTTSVQGAFFMFRGIFLDDKKWDEVPDGRGY